MQLSLLSGPKMLSTLQHDLRTDERVVRWMLVKRQALARLPKQKELRQIESELCAPSLRTVLRTLLTRARAGRPPCSHSRPPPPPHAPLTTGAPPSPFLSSLLRLSRGLLKTVIPDVLDVCAIRTMPIKH